MLKRFGQRNSIHHPGEIMIVKKAWAVWKGSIKEGGGTMSTETGVLKEAPYGFRSRFENGKSGRTHRCCACRLLFDGLVTDARHRRHDTRKNRDPRGSFTGQGRRRLRNYRKSPDCEGQDSRGQRNAISGDRQQSQSRLSGIEGAEG